MLNKLREIDNNSNDTLSINGTYSRTKTSPYGLQTVACKLNDAGVPTAMADPNTISFQNNNTAYVETGLQPSLPVYTIQQVIGGKFQDFGAEYFIDPEFDKAGGWTGNANAVVDNGVCTFTDVPDQGAIRSYDGTLTTDTEYQYTVKINSISKGSVRVRFYMDNGAVADSDIYTEAGVHRGIITPSSDGNNAGVVAVSETSCEIEYLHLRPLEDTKTNKVESRVLVRDSDTVRYYINSIEQDHIPELPVELETIKISNVPIIGYEDTVNTVFNPFSISNKVMIPTASCSVTGDEHIYNSSFDCGMTGWNIDGKGSIVDQENSTISVSISKAGSSLYPLIVKDPLAIKDDGAHTELTAWIFDVKCIIESGTAEVYIEFGDGSTYTEDLQNEHHTVNFTGLPVLVKIRATDDDFVATFDLVSLKSA